MHGNCTKVHEEFICMTLLGWECYKKNCTYLGSLEMRFFFCFQKAEPEPEPEKPAVNILTLINPIVICV